MSSQPLWRGVAAALVTLFDQDGRVDHAATAAHADRLLGHGVPAVLVAGSTGEADALTDAERVTLVTAVRQAVPDDVPVLAGAGGAWTGEVVARVGSVVEADAVLVAPASWASMRRSPRPPTAGRCWRTTFPAWPGERYRSRRCLGCRSPGSRTPPGTPSGCCVGRVDVRRGARGAGRDPRGRERVPAGVCGRVPG